MNNELTVVASFPTAIGVEPVVADLTAAGIAVQVEGSATHGMLPGIGGEVRLLVATVDVEKARAIIAAAAAPASSAAALPASPLAIKVPASRYVAAMLTVVAVTAIVKWQQAAHLLEMTYARTAYGVPEKNKEGCLVYPWKGTRVPGYAICPRAGDQDGQTIRSYSRAGVLDSESDEGEDNQPADDVVSYDNNGVIYARFIDADRDGVFEFSLRFDRRGEEVASAANPKFA